MKKRMGKVNKEEKIAKLRRQVGELEGEMRLVKEKCSTAEEFLI